LVDDEVNVDEHEVALALERCERDNAEPELGLTGERKESGGSMRSEERDEGSECEDDWGTCLWSRRPEVEADDTGWLAATREGSEGLVEDEMGAAFLLRAAAREMGAASALPVDVWLAPRVNQEEK
jgi:hypothetical protein